MPNDDLCSVLSVLGVQPNSTLAKSGGEDYEFISMDNISIGTVRGFLGRVEKQSHEGLTPKETKLYQCEICACPYNKWDMWCSYSQYSGC